MSKIKFITETVGCVVDGMQWGEYVTAGETYETSRRADGKGDVYFSGPRGCTMMRPWQFARAIKHGWIKRANPAPKGWDVAETSVEV